MLKYIDDCNTYKSALVTPQVYSEQMCAALVNMKTKGQSIDTPKRFIFQFDQKN